MRTVAAYQLPEHIARLLSNDEPTEFETFTGSVWGHLQGMENA
jgi:hypothetical protein